MRIITVARKPLGESTIAANVLAHETGALNIDGTRIAHADAADLAQHVAGVQAIKARGGTMQHSWKNSSDLSGANDVQVAGRWPANLILAAAVSSSLDKQSGITVSTGGRTIKRSGGGNVGSGKASEKWFTNDDPGFGDTGGASRYFKVIP